MGKTESLWKSLQKFSSVLSQISTEPMDCMKKAWFINTLSKKMQLWVKNQKPGDFEEALVFSDSYIDSEALERSKQKKRRDKEDEAKEEESKEDEKSKKMKKKKSKENDSSSSSLSS
ncbi:unnamed protein product [Calypogeia fissa]